MHDIHRRTMVTTVATAWGGLLLAGGPACAQRAAPLFDASRNRDVEKIAPYRARFGRTRPLVAVVALNEGTRSSATSASPSARSRVADVVSVSVTRGPVKMQPLTFQLQETIDDSDRRYPQEADYVFVPAVENDSDPGLLRWIRAQAARGYTVISICYGVMAVANIGLFDGHRATSHYSNEAMRIRRFPKVRWQKSIRYVADGKVVSSAGVSASMPTSIAGPAKAAQVARDVGIDGWSSRHDSDAFQSDPGNTAMPPRDARPDVTLAIPAEAGDDEIALALTAESCSRTGNTMAYAVAAGKAPTRLAHGLVVLPDIVTGDGTRVDRTLAPLEAHQATRALDIALTDIAKIYGITAARNVALFMEYPGPLG